MAKADPLVQALRSTGKPTGEGDPGKSVEQLSDETGTSVEKVRAKLRLLHRKGQLVCGHRATSGIDGRTYRTNVYRLKGGTDGAK